MGALESAAAAATPARVASCLPSFVLPPPIQVSAAPLKEIVSVPSAELSAPAVGARRAPRAAAVRLPAGNRFYAGLALVALVIAAISLAVPSTASYDPWSWLIWGREIVDRKSTRLNSSHANISYAVFCLKKKTTDNVFTNYSHT